LEFSIELGGEHLDFRIGIVLILTVIGGISSLAVIPMPSLTGGYVAWHLLPYLLVSVLAFSWNRSAVIWIGAAGLMAIVDVWIFGESVLGSSSTLLMFAGMLASLKLFTLLPLGAGLGFCFQWIYRRRKSRERDGDE